MKTFRALLILALAALASNILSAQDYTYKVMSRDGYRYEGEWPSGYGVLYSYEDGLILGDFRKGKPHGKCVCYKPNGEVYWGEYRKGKATGKGRIYRDNGIVVTGDYKNGRYHGVDTLYTENVHQQGRGKWSYIHIIEHKSSKNDLQDFLEVSLRRGILQKNVSLSPTLRSVQFSSVQSLSCVRFFETPWTAARQASLSITNSRILLKLMSIKSVMPSNHLILCHLLLLLPSIFPSIKVFSSESVLQIRWPKDWSFSFSISPSNEYSGLISFRMDWLDFLAVQGTLKSLLQHHISKASILQCSAFFTVQLTSIHDHWKNHSLD